MSTNLTIAINDLIAQTANKIDSIAELEFPNIASQLVKDTFDTKGAATGRNWKANAPSTIKRKGFDSRNTETGLLEDALSQPGFILDDDYMGRLPSRSVNAKGHKSGGDYQFANSIDNYANRFDNLGRTANDEKYMLKRLVEVIINVF